MALTTLLRHEELLSKLLQSKIVQHEEGKTHDTMQSLESTYKRTYFGWTANKASTEFYDAIKSLRAYTEGDGKFAPGDLWSRHLLARCFILEARDPRAGEEQIQLRERALRYCEELKGALSKATEPLVSSQDIGQLEELIKLEQSVFNPEPHVGLFQKFKAMFLGRA
ncbi:MAG: hypothetical protein L6R36_007004 [Xanthoria steineri]|nr:MAG: hypothetical protein L6R36_007004 [Xanthoria steineri]